MSMDREQGGSGAVEVVDDPAQLVRQYEEGSGFLLASPAGTLLARGVEATVPKMGSSRGSWPVADRVAGFFDNALAFGRRDPVVVGAVPFDDNLPAHLVLPTEIRRAGPLHGTADAAELGGRRAEGPQAEVLARSTPGPAEYVRGVRRVLARLGGEDSDAAVLGRCLQLPADPQIDAARALRALSARASGGTFAVALPRRGEDGSRDSFGPAPALERTLLGSSPDLLVSRRGPWVTVHPRAGSVPRGHDRDDDGERAAELVASDRHRREHALEVSSVAEAVRSLCDDVRVSEEPTATASATAWHLRSSITGRLRDDRHHDPAASSLSVATAVHAASSVCGSPVARSAVAEGEPFDRGYFCGLVGWCDASGDGDWMVADRCAEIEHDVLRVFTSAGIVSGCDPDAELAATTSCLLDAVSVLHDGDGRSGLAR